MALNTKIGIYLLLAIFLASFTTAASFNSTWDTTKTGVSNADQVKLPLEIDGTYAFTVDWGDGSSDLITVWNQSEVTHTYASSGRYNISINGTIQGFRFANTGDKLKILDISNWGDLNLGNKGRYFDGCSNLDISATDALDLTGTTDLSYMFANVGQYFVDADFTSWDTSGVTDMSYVFDSSYFDGNVSTWNTSGVINMEFMFNWCNFNGDLNSWDVSSVENMYGMFMMMPYFNQPLDNWDTSSVADMSYMFNDAPMFNQDISSWNMSSNLYLDQIVTGTSFSVENYDALLIGFASQSPYLQDSVQLDVDVKYTSAAVNARSILVNTHSWDITDAGLQPTITTPTPTISFENGIRSVDSDLYCNDTILDPQGDNINVTVRWYKDGVLNRTLDYNNGYAVDTLFSAVLDSENTNLGDIWRCSLRFHDGSAYSDWGNSSLLTITNSSSIFISIWDTSKAGVSNSTSISLPLESDGNYNFTIDWGDGNLGEVTSWNDVDKNHTYSIPGEYEILIDGTIQGFRFDHGGDKLKLLDISQWGTLNLGNNGGYFSGCSNLDISATDTLDLTGTTTFYDIFYDCEVLSTPNFNNWDTSNVTNMDNAFLFAFRFNGNISDWNTSNVVSMNTMFYDADRFNQDISGWDVSNVIDMGYMLGSDSFNQDISGWDVSSVQDMSSMFREANLFNQNLSSWNTSNVVDMNGMFSFNSGFNGDISGWDTHNVTSMQSMFKSASSFNQDISGWNMSNVVTMWTMFDGSGLSTLNYNKILIGWASQSPNLQDSVNLHASGIQYTSAAISARNDTLIGIHSWSISDGGLTDLATGVDLLFIQPSVNEINMDFNGSYDLLLNVSCVDSPICGSFNVSLNYVRDEDSGYYDINEVSGNNYNSEYPCSSSHTTSGDDEIRTYSLGFDFPFFGEIISSTADVYLDTNGRLTFDDIGSNYEVNTGEMESNRIIAFLWNDLGSASYNNEYFCSNLTAPVKYAVFRVDSEWYDGAGIAQSELILFENGSIKINHGSITPGSFLQGVSSGKGISYYDIISDDYSDKSYYYEFNPNYVPKTALDLDGSPFYTTSSNPKTLITDTCLDNMTLGDSCILNWTFIANMTEADSSYSIVASMETADSNYVAIKFDVTAPTVTFTMGDTSYYLNDDTSYSCTGTDDFSGALTGTVTGLSTSTTGTRIATCTVTDDAGNVASETISYTVERKRSSSGGNYTPPPSDTVQSTYIDSLPVGTVTVSFDKDTLEITSVDIGVGEEKSDVKITGKSLLEKPSDLPEVNVNSRSRKAYKYLEIVHDNLDNEGITEAKITFKVPKSWVEANTDNPEDVMLYRFTEFWTGLVTTLLGEEGDNYVFSADSPGMSYFAIGLKNEVFTESPSETEKPSVEKTVETSGESESVTAEVVDEEVMPEEESKGFPVGVFIGLLAMIIIGMVVFIANKKE
ncbi:hypothetical protein C0585_07935 [Candidatus Woesearchaeota archaeon]|nr:MAG: hypothetical protein C0585_07935 [Candidatus Woesearchaeota archaeon]